ncbi:DUF3105 domain-containing protein [Deinococcus soli (ex Cha et al. 2016)]|uniref:DUF3105 domain-containing protein n=2 Tax=Deinococcus soli (ex Cha et al. 2016) TaxID=1309411 RepID=A0AAE3XAW8_9DEIO|nr:DUF3105 domain-containing protein [Deinococcus soli (ex Cha et al. 2016)]MDR6218400.1 hypothetical protein [Deinococcus soli (ex Cha et al. 2016)]MDR6329140.1 hypothetical protein [Deinococcus soli (ex Cha et al. 2016)]MDR6751413.1 hypothetical protein [Deinococcus soli (ex Cha et al. 2016)]
MKMSLLLLPLLLAACAPQPLGETTFTYEGGLHQDGRIEYAETPPVGGLHNPVWQNCGLYARPVPRERAVHAMEHGAVWITYRPDLNAADLGTLRDLASRHTYLLVSPFPGLDEPVVMNAWNRQLRLAAFDPGRVRAFVQAFEQAASAPERGALCTGGSSEVE